MQGLSNEIGLALDTVIEGLELPFDLEQDDIDDNELKEVVSAKQSALNISKSMLQKWMESPNAPSEKKLKEYANKLVKAGETSLESLRKALSKKIDYENLGYTKHNASIKAKDYLIQSIFLINDSILELKNKLDNNEFSFTDLEFKLGYPERMACGELIDQSKDIKNHYDSVNDVILLDKKGTRGEIIEFMDDLKVQLPEVPKNKKDILFYKEKKENQYWRRIPIPDITPENIHLHEKFILQEYHRRIYGVWFMNNGVPTYLTGNHYFALQYGKMFDGGVYMDFRHAQKMFMYHAEACIVDKRCLGQIFVKSRRTGATYMILAKILNSATITQNGLYGMTSMDDTAAKKAFQKLSYMFLNLPFWIRPIVQGKEEGTSYLYFGKPSDNTKSAKKSRKINIDSYLNTQIDYMATKDSAYDSTALKMYLGDESGKWKPPNDYIKHLGQITPTMMPNGEVVGKMFLCSTVGSMKHGGKQFRQIFEHSIYNERNTVNGKTTTGLYRYFMPAQDNMKLFTDKYGFCHTEAPTEYVENVIGNQIIIGSISHLISEEDEKRKQSDEALNEQYRAYPRTLEHAFRDESVSSSFNINKIYEQLDYLNTQKGLYVVGNFDWATVKDGDVVFTPNKNGRVKVSWIPKKDEYITNNVREENGWFYPCNTDIGCLGIDPYSLKDTRGRGSLGAIHGKTLDVPRGDAPKDTFFLEYLCRPSDEIIFYEDVIKIMRFYSIQALIERNVIGLIKYLYDRGYRPFVMNRIDKQKNEMTKDELKYGGQPMSGESVQEAHINAINTWINNNIGNQYTEDEQLYFTNKMPFEDTLHDWLKFTHENRTKHDATISSGLAIMACNKERYKVLPKPLIIKQPLFKKFNYKDINSIIH